MFTTKFIGSTEQTQLVQTQKIQEEDNMKTGNNGVQKLVEFKQRKLQT